jgi:hypothetical protein
LLADPHHLAYGVGVTALMGLLYTLTVIGMAIVKMEITTPPWLIIPAENYYFWQIFFAAPVFLAGWILAAGLVQLLSKPFGGAGTFSSGWQSPPGRASGRFLPRPTCSWLWAGISCCSPLL